MIQIIAVALIVGLGVIAFKEFSRRSAAKKYGR
jgi:hypothetical protein